MSNKKNVFLTGITGFLGSFLAVELLKKGYRVFGLARGKRDKNAQQRVWDALKFVYENDLEDVFVKKNVKVVEGDIVYPDLGIKDKKLRELLEKETDIIIHSAALVEIREPLEKIREINVEGVRRVFDFALRCRENGRLKKINHISTAYVIGDRIEKFDEKKLEIGQGFYNTYEQSKYEAELLSIEYAKRGLNISTFRPGMIMGDSITGKTSTFRLFYQPLRHFADEIFEYYPGELSCVQNLINVDSVASAVVALLEKESPEVYHIVSPKETTIGFFMEVAAKYLHFKMPKFIPQHEFNFNLFTPIQRKLAEPFYPYFNHPVRFVSFETVKTLKDLGFEYPPVDENNLEKIFKYCLHKRFIKNKADN